MTTKQLFTLCAVFLSLLVASSAPSQATDPTATEIDAIFADYDTTTSPGCSLGVVRDGEMIYKRGYGMANLEYGIALSPRSVFRTASVSKQFTAMAVAILDQQEIISLDDPLSKYFPEFPGWADEITIRHLVHQTSGIRDYLTLAWLAGKGDEDYYTDEFALDLLARQRSLNFAPGDDQLYSNSGYLLLAHTVTRATGKSLRQWAAENMFGPLGMTHSHFHDDHTHIVSDRADGYSPSEEGFSISMTNLDMVGDGGVYTTIEDFLLWDRNFYDNKLGTGGDELIQLVTTPGQLNSQEEMTYAFGLDVDEYRGLPMVSHDGSFVGFRTDTTRFPEQKLSVVVYCNRADANPSQRSRKVAELYLADLMAPEVADTTEDASEAKPIDWLPAELERITGHYWSSDNRFSREIRTEEGKLMYVRSPESKNELRPLTDGGYRMLGVPVLVEVRFEPTDSTPATRMVATVAGSGSTTLERFEAWQPSADELHTLAGTYFSDELDAELVLEEVDGELRVRIGASDQTVLLPVYQGLFTTSDGGAIQYELTTAAGRGEGFILDADRARGLEFKRQ